MSRKVVHRAGVAHSRAMTLLPAATRGPRRVHPRRTPAQPVRGRRRHRDRRLPRLARAVRARRRWGDHRGHGRPGPAARRTPWAGRSRSSSSWSACRSWCSPSGARAGPSPRARPRPWRWCRCFSALQPHLLGVAAIGPLYAAVVGNLLAGHRHPRGVPAPRRAWAASTWSRCSARSGWAGGPATCRWRSTSSSCSPSPRSARPARCPGIGRGRRAAQPRHRDEPPPRALHRRLSATAQ